MGEDAAENVGLVQRGQDAHPAVAAGALEDVDAKHAAHEFGPGQATVAGYRPTGYGYVRIGLRLLGDRGGWKAAGRFEEGEEACFE